MLKKTALVLLVAGLSACAANESSAQVASNPCMSCMSGIVTGNRVIAPNPPYFAVHPPVYYDRIVPRAFGMSPYAVPPGVMPIENTIPVPPKSVSNPYFKGQKANDSNKKQPAKKNSKVASFEKRLQPKKVSNPFYLAKVVKAQ